MDGFEKLLLTNSLISTSSNDSKSFLQGFIAGFMSCIIICIFLMTCYNTFKSLVNTQTATYSNSYYTPRAIVSNIPMNTIQDMERFINYNY